MEKRELRVCFSKSGAGNLTPRVSLPAIWIKEMGLNLDNRDIEVVFENNEIIIRKKDC